MYRLGEKIGVDGLTRVFDLAGVGRPTGIGLPEEEQGINPTPTWLVQHRRTPITAGHARNFAIGQGEMGMTPVQVANLMASYGSGRSQPLTLIMTKDVKPASSIPAAAEYWRAIRRGMYLVVNDPDGTAYKFAHFVHDRYALCGKTGSATVHPWPTAYRIPYVDGNGAEGVAIIREGAKEPAVDRFRAENPGAKVDAARVEVADRWPPDAPSSEDRYSHAWFGGFLQRLGRDGQPDWAAPPRVAFAVMIEFGGSGGRTSGPLAKRVAGELIDVLGPELNPDGPGSQ
jgi:cell division protein FtsI/penicillin-binding protein 2